MMRYKGGNKVGKGTYWNLTNGNRVDIGHEGILPGDEKSEYSRIAPGLMLLMGPVYGLLYVLVLPFIVIASVVTLLGGKALDALMGLASRIVYFEWRPTEAYFSGRKKGQKERQKKDLNNKD
ncbi:hypothetical protein BMS3Abin07_02112 [bacterium BMS3Abin07]|nr:hypothetical protein BMS3Abin07_02112 [bacterium BMS3Abin07]GBE32547.1 hypothetical protein BMS3Bbin05_01463 [bacterium BMS3Bbin05]HDO22256.1 hypothetical protein [Nitrospirota bacterium]HDZ88328.1 hypothetical protein [Nitrospirota bacterium]